MSLYFNIANPEEVQVKLLWWQEKGLQYTATGYGGKIPTGYVVKHNGKWRRVYLKVYSNIGTMFVMQGKEKVIVDLS